MEPLMRLCDILEKDIEMITNKGDITPQELERLYKAVDIVKDIKTIEAMQESGYNNEEYGYSRNSYGMHGRMNASYSNRRPYYSRNTEKEQLEQQIEDMKYRLSQM